jgi:hypothetical protein
VSHRLIKYLIVVLNDGAIIYQIHAVESQSNADVEVALFDILEMTKRVTIHQSCDLMNLEKRLFNDKND